MPKKKAVSKTAAKKATKKAVAKKAAKKTARKAPAKKATKKAVARNVGGRPKGSLAASPNHAPSMRALAAQLNRDKMSIAAWVKEAGNPGKDKTGQYHLPSWREWIEKSGKNFKDTSDVGKTARARKAEVDAKIQEIKLKQLEGRSIDLEEAVEVLGGMISEFKQSMLSMAKTYSSKIAGQDAGTVERIISERCREMLAQIAVPDEKKKPKKEGDSSLFWTNVSESLSGLRSN